MSSIGKSPRLVSRVKSEFTVTGRRTGTPKLTTPGNSQIPVPKTPLTPQTAFERNKFVTRRRLMIGDATSHLTRSSPSNKVRGFVHQEAPEKVDVCSCDPELQGTETLNPNCIFVNVCQEHVKVAFRCSNVLKRLWTFVGKCAQFLMACATVGMIVYGVLHLVFWMLGGKGTERSSEEASIEIESNFEEEDNENDGEEQNYDVMVLSPNDFSLTETTNAFNLVNVLIMTIRMLFGWIGGILLPDEE